MGERNVAGLRLDVDQDGMTLVEGTALRVLTAEAYGRSRSKQRGVGDELRHAVVEEALAFGHLCTLLEELLDLRMNVEVGRSGGRQRHELRDPISVEAGNRIIRRSELAPFEGRPIVGKPGQAGFVLGLGGELLVIEKVLLDGSRFGGRVYTDLRKSGRGLGGL